MKKNKYTKGITVSEYLNATDWFEVDLTKKSQQIIEDWAKENDKSIDYAICYHYKLSLLDEEYLNNSVRIYTKDDLLNFFSFGRLSESNGLTFESYLNTYHKF